MLIDNHRGVYLVWHFGGKYNAVFTHNHAMKKCRKQRTHGDKVCPESAAKIFQLLRLSNWPKYLRYIMVKSLPGVRCL